MSFFWVSYKAFDNRERYIETQAQKDVLNARVDSMRIENAYAKTIYLTALNKIITNSSDYDDIPLPLWYKVYDKTEDNFKMVYLNRAYEEAYQVKRMEYLGKLDTFIYSSSIGEKYQRNDKTAYLNEKPLVFEEEFLKPDGSYGTGKYLKWRIDKGGSSYIYGMELERN